MASGDESRSHAEKLRSPSPSLYLKVIDISEVAMFHVNAENGDADEHECYSLEDLAHYVKLTNLKSTNEELAARVIETLGNQDIVVVHNKEVPGARDLFPTEYSSIYRSDVTVYNANKAKVLLQIEVQSSPMREAVFKAIYGAANLLRLFRNSSTNCKEFIVFTIPRKEVCCEDTCCLEGLSIQLYFRNSLDRKGCLKRDEVGY